MLEIAEIFRKAKADFLKRFGSTLLPSQHRALRDIVQCQTPALGGHVYACDACSRTQFSYHSCRNRHCPKCEQQRTEAWIEKQSERLLPCGYFLLTFTLPEPLRDLAFANQREVYDVLMRCAAAALQKLAADPAYLGAVPGMISVLHTWTRDLRYHPHVHLLATAGGLSEDGTVWREPKHPGFLVPGRALSVIFRAKVRDAFDALELRQGTPRKVWRTPWVVHVKPAGSGERVIAYLGRYLFRTAIANSRIERFADGRVTFRYRDGRTQTMKRCLLPVAEFMRRFLQHTLPRGFTRVRHYGCFSTSSAAKREHARKLLIEQGGDLGERHATCVEVGVDADTPTSTPETVRHCPSCRTGVMQIVGTLPRAHPPRAPPPS